MKNKKVRDTLSFRLVNEAGLIKKKREYFYEHCL